MDGHRSVCALADVQEAPRDDVAGRAAVQEEEVAVVEAGVDEALGVVDLLVQTDDGGHVVLPEVREVGLGRVEGVACRGRRRSGQTPGREVLQLEAGSALTHRSLSWF